MSSRYFTRRAMPWPLGRATALLFGKNLKASPEVRTVLGGGRGAAPAAPAPIAPPRPANPPLKPPTPEKPPAPPRPAAGHFTSAPAALGPGCAFPAVRLALTALALMALTAAAARAQGLSQTFDTATPPALPTGWFNGTGWTTSTTSASPGSGLNNLANTGTGAENVVSEAFSLVSATGATLTYLARRTSSYPAAALVVTASIDGGITYSIPVVAAPGALPVATSTWATITAPIPAALLGQADVRLRFEAAGGTSSSASIRLDDVEVTPTDGGGGEGGTGGASSTLGFSQATSTTPAETPGFEVDVALVEGAAPGLQAFQFTATWSDELLALTSVVPGAAISNLADWNVSSSIGAGTATILVISPSGASLAAGAYDPVLRLRFDVGELPGVQAQDVTVTLSNPVGALAVATGTDAALGLGRSSHVVTVAPRRGVFSAPASVTVGQATALASVSATLVVSNAGGTAPLVITNAVSSDPKFEVTPTTATIAPDATAVFTIVFTPTGTSVGSQSAILTFAHDGSNGPATTVSMSATALSSRGDADSDALVDVVDVLAGVDVALGRTVPTATVLASLDLYPFPTGDGSVDVRDLTVLVQAILAGQWPDGIALPVPPAGKGFVAGGAAVSLVLNGSGSGPLQISVRADEPLRALQADVYGRGVGAAARVISPAGKAAPQVGIQADRVRLVWVSLAGSELPAGESILLELDGVPASALSVGYALAVAADGSRRTVTVEVPVSETDLEAPYPNPFRPLAGERLRIRAEGVVEIMNLLGRRVRTLNASGSTSTWDGLDTAGQPVAPGLYFVQIPGARARARAVVLTR